MAYLTAGTMTRAPSLTGACTVHCVALLQFTCMAVCDRRVKRSATFSYFVREYAAVEWERVQRRNSMKNVT